MKLPRVQRAQPSAAEVDEAVAENGVVKLSRKSDTAPSVRLLES